jgi:hypothetical protein
MARLRAFTSALVWLALAVMAIPAAAACGPETWEAEVRCTAQRWNNQTCTCTGGTPGDPCKAEPQNVPACYGLMIGEFQRRVAAAQEEMKKMLQYCREIQAWARASGMQPPRQPCD